MTAVEMREGSSPIDINLPCFPGRYEVGVRFMDGTTNGGVSVFDRQDASGPPFDVTVALLRNGEVLQQVHVEKPTAYWYSNQEAGAVEELTLSELDVPYALLCPAFGVQVLVERVSPEAQSILAPLKPVYFVRRSRIP